MEKELELYIKANYAKLEGDTLVSVKDAFEAAWQARVPEGYVVVPKEPTPKMIDVGMGGFCFPLDNGCFNNHDLICAYRAMIEAVENEK